MKFIIGFFQVIAAAVILGLLFGWIGIAVLFGLFILVGIATMLARSKDKKNEQKTT